MEQKGDSGHKAPCMFASTGLKLYWDCTWVFDHSQEDAFKGREQT